MPPVPIGLALPLAQVIPIHILAVLLLPVNVVRPIFVSIPNVVVVVFSVVITPFVLMIIMVLRQSVSRSYQRDTESENW